MKKIAVLPPDDVFLGNTFFDLDSKYNRDNCLYPHYLFKQVLEQENYKVKTIDYYSIQDEIDFILVFNIDNNLAKLLETIENNEEVRVIYIMTEPQVVKTLHNRKVLESHIFDLVLSWNDSFCKSESIKKYYYPNPRKTYQNTYSFEQKKDLCIINANKGSSHECELYTERRKAISFFSKHQSIDLYGFGWNEERDTFIEKAYKGTVKDKIKTLQEYKFCICFENSSCEPGYITEKIFDAFSAGCIPIYYGAPNVDEYIPRDCFIDFKKFTSYGHLLKYLGNMDINSYKAYQLSIQEFLDSNKYELFTSQNYVQILQRVFGQVKSRKHNLRSEIFDLIKRTFKSNVRLKELLKIVKEVAKYYWRLA